MSPFMPQIQFRVIKTAHKHTVNKLGPTSEVFKLFVDSFTFYCLLFSSDLVYCSNRSSHEQLLSIAVGINLNWCKSHPLFDIIWMGASHAFQRWSLYLLVLIKRRGAGTVWLQKSTVYGVQIQTHLWVAIIRLLIRTVGVQRDLLDVLQVVLL